MLAGTEHAGDSCSRKRSEREWFPREACRRIVEEAEDPRGMNESSPEPKMVSRFEANLLRILRFFLKQAPAEQAMKLINDRMDRPKCLSAAAVELVEDSLSKG